MFLSCNILNYTFVSHFIYFSLIFTYQKFHFLCVFQSVPNFQPAFDSNADVQMKRVNSTKERKSKSQTFSKDKEPNIKHNKNNHKVAEKPQENIIKSNTNNIQKKKTSTAKVINKSDSFQRKDSPNNKAQSKSVTKDNNPNKSDSFNNKVKKSDSFNNKVKPQQKKVEPKVQLQKDNIKPKEPKKSESFNNKTNKKQKEIVDKQDNKKAFSNKTQINSNPNKIPDDKHIKNTLQTFLNSNVEEKEDTTKKSYSRKPRSETVAHKAKKEHKIREKSISLDNQTTAKNIPLKQTHGLTFDDRLQKETQEHKEDGRA